LVALYNRAKGGLAGVGDESLAEDSRQLAALLKKYGVGLTA